MSVTFDDSHLMVFGSQETAEVFLWEVRSAATAAESVPARGWEQFQIQDRQHKCVSAMLLMLSCPGSCALDGKGWDKGRALS